MKVSVPLTAENGTPRPFFNDRSDSFGNNIRCIIDELARLGIDTMEPFTIHIDRAGFAVHAEQ